MQDNLMQAQTLPFVKLAQANMDLFTRFSTSPEVTTQASANASQLFQQASESAMKLMQSDVDVAAFVYMLKHSTVYVIDRGTRGRFIVS